MTKRKEVEKRRFRRLIAQHQNSGNTIKETNASVRKAEETRKKIQHELEVRSFTRYQSCGSGVRVRVGSYCARTARFLALNAGKSIL